MSKKIPVLDESFGTRKSGCFVKHLDYYLEL